MEFGFFLLIAAAWAWLIPRMIVWVLTAIMVTLFYAVPAVFKVTGYLLSLIINHGPELVKTLGSRLHGAMRPMLLIYFLLLELVRSEEAPSDDQDEGEPHPRDDRGSLNAACRLLGLTEGAFTRDDLKRAYRQAIRAAHPDLTGNTEDAVRINRARDDINNHYGWT